jgi:hypothetical protein
MHGMRYTRETLHTRKFTQEVRKWDVPSTYTDPTFPAFEAPLVLKRASSCIY